MQGEGERKALLRAANQLRGELGFVPGQEVPGALSPNRWQAGVLDSRDELLVSTMRRILAEVVAAAAERTIEDQTERDVRTALDAVELVLRGQLRNGPDRLPNLLSTFVFLVTLPVVEPDRALALSQRTETLLDKALAEERGGS